MAVALLPIDQLGLWVQMLQGVDPRRLRTTEREKRMKELEQLRQQVSVVGHQSQQAQNMALFSMCQQLMGMHCAWFRYLSLQTRLVCPYTTRFSRTCVHMHCAFAR
jgi:hypothetical protein